jgi:integrase
MRRLEEYLATKHDIEPKAKDNYRIALRSLEPFLAPEEIEDVYLDPKKVNMALNKLSQQIEDSSWNLRLSLFKCYVRWLHDSDDEELPRVWRKIKPKKIDWEEKLKDKWLNEQEFLNLLNATDNLCFRAAWATAQSGALRRGELSGLKVGNAEVQGNEVKVTVTGKTGTRCFVMNQLAPVLKLWLNFHPYKNDPNAPLWIKRRNSHGGLYKGIGARSLDKLFKMYAARAGIKKPVSLHWLRHTKVTWTARNRKIRVNDKQANAMFGWSSNSEMYKRYTHLHGTDTDDAFRLLDGVEVTEVRPDAGKILQRRACFNCNELNDAMALYCVKCGWALNEAVAEKQRLMREMQEEALKIWIEKRKIN